MYDRSCVSPWLASTQPEARRASCQPSALRRRRGTMHAVAIVRRGVQTHAQRQTPTTPEPPGIPGYFSPNPAGATCDKPHRGRNGRRAPASLSFIAVSAVPTFEGLGCYLTKLCRGKSLGSPGKPTSWRTGPMTSPKRWNASSDSQTSTTRQPSSVGPAACERIPSGQSLSELKPPLLARRAPTWSYCSWVPPGCHAPSELPRIAPPVGYVRPS